MISLEEYQQGIVRTAVVTDPAEMYKLAFLGLLGELGEIAEPIKKHLYSGHECNQYGTGNW